MKTLKLSFALIIAVLAVGVTVATKAGNLAVTRCFTSITVTDGSAPVSLDQLDNCNVAQQAIITDQKIYLTAASLANSIESEASCPPSNVKFCCVEVEEVTEADDPNFEFAAELNLGEGLKRYVATAVYCKP